jgi:hypothetical protein
VNSMSGRRSTMPSSECIACTSTPNRSRIRALTASAQGACTCARTARGWRPASHRARRGTARRRSRGRLGTWPVASRCSRR